MNKIISDKLPQLIQLCKSYKVESLYIFGSVNTETFRPDSDVDFLITFGDVDLFDYFDNYLDLKEKLEEIFKRPVDLVEEKTVKNPVLRRSIDKNKLLIYGRAS